MNEIKEREKKFIEKAKLIHIDENNNPKYDYSEVKYVGAFIKVKIICNIKDNNGKLHGIFLQQTNSHLYGHGCPTCSGRKKSTLEEFIEKSNKVHNYKYDYSLVEYKNNKTKVKIICKVNENSNIHGIFEVNPVAHFKDSLGCPLCFKQKFSEKYSTKSFIERAKLVHGDKYDYSETKYISVYEKVKIKCYNKEGEIHEFWQRPSDHLAGSKCSKCNKSKPVNTEEFIEKARKIHGNKYDYSEVEYVHYQTKIKIYCKVIENNIPHSYFWQTPAQHTNAKSNCPKCASFNRLSFDDFVKRANIIYNNKYDYSMVDNVNRKNRDKIKIICHEKDQNNEPHGIFYQNISFHLSDEGGCTKCKSHNRCLRAAERFLKKAKKINNELDYSLVDFKDIFTKVIFICNKKNNRGKVHGEFLKTPNSFLKSAICPKCQRKIISKSETEWLDTFNIPFYNRNKSVIINNKRFYPDAYIPETKTIYEFYGDFWHGNPEVFNPNDINKRNKKTFGELYKKTLEKERILKEAGYNIISIWEANWNKLKKEINE